MGRPCQWLTLVLAVGCSTPVQPPPGASGRQIYELQLCANCHGKQREGRSLGPPLRELGAHWTRDELVDFLADVEGWEERSPRLRELQSAYSGNMDSYANLSEPERARLADFLLN